MNILYIIIIDVYFNITQIEIDIEPTDKVSNQLDQYTGMFRYRQAYHESAI